MNRPSIKPGWKSSEFWLTAVSFVFSGLYLIGLLDDHSQKEDLINETSRGVEAVILIIGQLTVLFRYIKGRTEIKKTWWNTIGGDNKVLDTTKSETPVESPTNDKPRKPKSKRKTTNSHKKQPRKSK